MRKFLFIFLILSFLLVNCKQEKRDLTALVDPFIGTGSDGHTFPGAVYPFGMVQLSPDTRVRGNDYATGYHYSDSSILGFSHTRYSGTGRGAGGDILFMPLTGPVQWNPGTREDPSSGYRSVFSHKEEYAVPGYYRVRLKDHKITAELTAGKRVGLHRYTWHQGDTAAILLDLVHGIHDRPDSLFLRITGPQTIEGFRRSLGGLRNYQTLWFAAEFSEPFDQHLLLKDGRTSDALREAAGKEVKAFFRFYHKKKIEVKVALSRVDIEGARNNLRACREKDFDDIRAAARQAWHDALGKIEITTHDPLHDTLFYTALYHTCILPSLDMDRDGRYRSPNNTIYRAKGYTNYTNFSLWDTFRGLHPLFTIINRRRTMDFLKTFLQRYRHTGSLPVFELSGNDLPVMIGFHSLPVIADAWVKGLRLDDSLKMLEGMKALARLPYGTRTTDTVFGYLPYDYTYQSVSRTLEYAYDDWCVARVAKDLDEETYHHYSQRANFYRDLYDPESGFMRPRDSHHRWLDNFNPLAYTRNYTQGNAWQYTTFVPHDIPGLIALMGSDRAFGSWLDRFFTTENPRTYQGRRSSLMIGQYYHGNEPSHHVAYLYNFAGMPWKTQVMVRRILATQYRPGPAGLAGNDDAGQMSAWYVLSALGFYSVTPGTDYYVLGSPLFDQAVIRLEDGNEFRIIAQNNSDENVYIQSATLNGKPYSRTYLRHGDIMRGGTLLLTMGPRPDTLRGTAPEERPPSMTYNDVPAPVITVADKQISPDGIVPFDRSCSVSLSCADPAALLCFTTDGSIPDTTSQHYTGPFRTDHSVILRVRGFREGSLPGYVSSLTLRRLDPLPATEVSHPQPGIAYTYRTVWVCRDISQMYQYPVEKTGVVPVIGTEMGFRMDEKNGSEFTGYLRIPRTGTYTFYLFSEDGSILYIDELCLIINEGTHRQTEIALEKGFHKILLKHVQVGGTPKLRLEWSGPGIPKQPIPPEACFH
jgi:predicted alpha-1,2-mannosidase